jgi:hypothetical protein
VPRPPPRLPHSCDTRTSGGASPARAVAPVRYRAARCAILRCSAWRYRSRGRLPARHRSPPRSAANATAVRHDYGQDGDRPGDFACSHQPVRPHPEPPGAQQRSVPDPQGRAEAAQPSAVRSDDRTDDASGAGSSAAVCRSRRTARAASPAARWDHSAVRQRRSAQRSDERCFRVGARIFCAADWHFIPPAPACAVLQATATHIRQAKRPVAPRSA